MTKHKQPNVAIVHDWLIGGGAERVTYELHRLYPDAPIYTSYCSDEWRKRLDNKVVTGFLQRWPFSRLRKFLPVLRIWWFTHLDFSGYDIVISVSGNGEAFGIKTSKNTVHINYCHTPTHYYWRKYDEYLKRPGFGALDPLARLGLKLFVGPLRRWDYRAAQRADFIIANSRHIQSDIKKYYHRNSEVIHPPVDTERFKPTSDGRSGFITVGRQTAYKRTDLIVQACTKLGAPLTVIGNGPEHKRLEAMAGPSVQFLTDVTDDAMPGHMAGAQAFLFAAFEDFGVTPVEALASGTPVIAYKAGGALDYITPGKTGEFFEQQTVSSVRKAIQAFDATKFRAQTVRAAAEQFSPAIFRQKIRDFVKKSLTR